MSSIDHSLTDCNAVMISINVFCLLTMSVTSFLFLRRVQAVYAGNHFVWWIFGFLWFGIIAADVMLFLGTHSRHIPGTYYCMLYGVKQYVSATSFIPAAFDTLVFFAISYKIAFRSINTVGADWSKVILGEYPSGVLAGRSSGGPAILPVSKFSMRFILPSQILIL